MPSYLTRPWGKTVTTEKAVRSWAEAPGIVPPHRSGTLTFPHHETLYLSPNGYYYIEHTYEQIGGETTGWGTSAVQTKTAWAEMVTHPIALEWLRKHDHEITPELRIRRVI